MIKELYNWPLSSFLLIFQFFVIVEQQQQQSLLFTRHFFVPARQKAVQQIRSRAATENTQNDNIHFRTITLSGGREFVLVPRHLFLQQRQRGKTPQATGSRVAKLHNLSQPEFTTMHDRNVLMHLQQRRGARVPNVRHLTSPAALPQAKQLPSTQFTSKRQISAPPRRQQQRNLTNPGIRTTKGAPRASPPPKLVPETLIAKQQQQTPLTLGSNKEGATEKRILQIKNRQQEFLRAQQREFKHIRELNEEKTQQKVKLGKSRKKIVEKSSKITTLSDMEHLREILVTKRPHHNLGANFSSEKIHQKFAERASIGTSQSNQQQSAEIRVTPTTSTTKENSPLNGTEGPLSPVQMTTKTNHHSMSPLSTPSSVSADGTTQTSNGITLSMMTSSTISSSSQLSIGVISSSPITSSTLPIPPISAIREQHGGGGDIGSPSPAATFPPSSLSMQPGPPGQMPPNDNVVAELNNATDFNFIEVGERLRLRELFGRKSVAARLALVV